MKHARAYERMLNDTNHFIFIKRTTFAEYSSRASVISYYYFAISSLVLFLICYIITPFSHISFSVYHHFIFVD